VTASEALWAAAQSAKNHAARDEAEDFLKEALAGGADISSLVIAADDQQFLAVRGFERLAIDDLDEAAAITDQPSALQEAGSDGRCGTADAEHLPEKFLCQRDRIAVDSVVRLQ
jgi:hypothetical protein